MNITELARKLRIPTSELRQILPEFGFDIGRKAIKVDDKVASQIIKDWKNILKEWRRKTEAVKEEEVTEPQEAAEKKGKVKLPSLITVREFSFRLGLPAARVIKELMKNRILASLNERIDYETAAIVAEDLGFETEKEEETEEIFRPAGDKIKILLEEEKEKLVSRPAVVVVLGHVDHGKTKLLDAIRKTHVVETEAGGITQHIGAYQAEKEGKKITFIDTPGHEAFSAMRSRGAKIADIAILVVAADDGVQPQTREAVDIIRAAKIPLVVAINKIDKPGINKDRVLKDLSELGLTPEEWGGKTICVPVSALSGEGIDDLLAMVLLVAEMEKERIVANPARLAVGTIIESHIDKNEGVAATLLVQTGTLKINDYLGSEGVLMGRARRIEDWSGNRLEAADPSAPVKILGFKFAPHVGDIIEAKKDIGELRFQKRGALAAKEVLRTLVSKTKEESKEKETFNIILKADTLGSLEAILESLEKISHLDAGVRVVAWGLGNITDTDVLRAEAGKAHVFGFNVAVIPTAEELLRDKEIPVRIFTIIYDLIKAAREEVEKLLTPEIITTELGEVKVKAVFRTERDSMIVGGAVQKGKVLINTRARVKRGDEILETGEVIGLQSAKREVKEVSAGQECGLKIKIRPLIEIGDIIEVYKEEVRERKLAS